MNKVKELRVKAGLQQKALALMIGVAQPTVSEWENQKKDPSGERLEKLCQLFNCNPEDLISQEVSGDIATSRIDSETWYLRERLRRSPELRMLFSAADNATPEHIKAAAAMLKALEGDEE